MTRPVIALLKRQVLLAMPASRSVNGVRKSPFATEAKELAQSSSGSRKKVLSLDAINSAVRSAEYAVRGAIPIRAEELRHDLADGKKLGFQEIINCNIGNPQQLGQPGLTFFRQVAALVECPDLIDHELAPQLFPEDVRQRARDYVKEIGSVGAYSHSKGVPLVRRHIAEFLERRDGFSANPDHIYLTTGASGGVSNLLQLMVSNPSCGVMIPIPQYPLYTAALALNSAKAVPYYLREGDDWSLDVKGLQQGLDEARADGTDVRAIVIINPGNPTGGCLPVDNIRDILKFAYDNSLVVMADEVYQTNVFDSDTRPFQSFRKALGELGEPYSKAVELVSFHSISKGQVGECGRRGGYFELINIDPQVEEQVYKIASIQLCPPVQGQLAVSMLVKPPVEGEPSYPTFRKETEAIISAHRLRSRSMHEAFNSLEGISCNPAHGAMYLFPRITVPEKAAKEAEKKKMAPDAFYCLELLEKTGICVVPGSGFRQEPGTLHFRTTFLAPQVEAMIDQFRTFHTSFMKEYA